MVSNAAASGDLPMDRVIASTCWECSAYCGSLITVNDTGRVTKIMPNPDNVSLADGCEADAAISHQDCRGAMPR